ncbi:F0F1 ATP synthase subunit B [Phycisphaerales bacterium AB-hyl4]|uniref:ATP synthase subunit b n=1 Tax=Natronomicrosphaera hydrolytica TaxID=3242702 RepID=A0ABV4U5V3_9BACT
MNTIWRFGITTTAALALTAPAFAQEVIEAAEAGSPGLLDWDPGEYIWTLIVFLGLLAILIKFVWPAILKGLQERELKIQSDLKRAEKANVDAQQTLEQYKAQLAEARKEAQHMIDQSRTEASRAAAQIKDEAQKELAQMRQRAERDIAAAKEQAIAELYEQTATIATDVAGQILRRELSADDQRALVEQSLSKLGETQQV